ncbi:lytic transglycosylase domain-containing protein [Actinomycetospora aeridis]|uniref:Lytic murein transglycosylase n=1 Tax=Actinomycetospora aeridis TaxID=3129231 RepID=A0ABU8N7J5_9PSEU
MVAATVVLAGVVASLGTVPQGASSAGPPLPPADTGALGATGAGPDLVVPEGPPVTTDGTVADIPEGVLAAYQGAEANLAGTAPGCRLPWSLVAGIGKVESDHARGGAIDGAGTTLSPILGPVLDGTGANAAIPDTDGGTLDGDTLWDRAVGPTQFIPSTFGTYGADGNGDGTADPNNVHDATVATGRYLCAGGLDLADPAQVHDAVFRYNHSESYVDTVLQWAATYAGGVTPVPDDPSGASGDPVGDLLPAGPVPSDVDVLADAAPAGVPVTDPGIDGAPVIAAAPEPVPAPVPSSDPSVRVPSRASSAPVAAPRPARPTGSPLSSSPTSTSAPTTAPEPSEEPEPADVPDGLCARAFSARAVAEAFDLPPGGITTTSAGSGSTVGCRVTGPAAADGATPTLLTAVVTSLPSEEAARAEAAGGGFRADGGEYTLVAARGALVVELRAPAAATSAAQARTALSTLAQRI